MEQIGNGDLTVQVTTTGNDEVAHISRALQTTTTNLGNMVRRIKEGAIALSKNTTEVREATTTLTATAQRMNQESSSVSSSASLVETNVNQIAVASESISSNVNTVASAIEEMSASLAEVQKACRDESNIAAEADVQSREAKELVGNLESAANQTIWPNLAMSLTLWQLLLKPLRDGLTDCQSFTQKKRVVESKNRSTHFWNSCQALHAVDQALWNLQPTI